MIKHDAVRAAASANRRADQADPARASRRAALVQAGVPAARRLVQVPRHVQPDHGGPARLPAAGIVAASGGNAGLAAAYAARELGVPAEVFVPVTAPPVKVAKLAKLGARVTQVGNEYAEAYAAAVMHAEETGARFCHAYDDPDMVAGNGTLGLELAEQLPDGFDTVLVAVGGGGLVAGVAAALHGRADRRRSSRNAARPCTPRWPPVVRSTCRSPGSRSTRSAPAGSATSPTPTAVATGMPSVLVDDEAIVDARRRLWEDYRIAVEHGTAAAYAALISGAYQPAEGERVVILLCGANTDPSDLGAV